MDIALFKEFFMVTKHGNLSEAARELNTTQPALSRHLSTIEKEFGIKLFDRRQSPMELTPEGEYFLKESKIILNEYARLTTHFHGAKEGSFDSIKVGGGVLDSCVSSTFLEARCLLAESRPYLSLKVIESNFQTPFDSLRESNLDLAVEPMSGMVDLRGIDSMKLACEQPYVVMEKSNPFATKVRIGTGEIAALSFTSLRSNKGHALRKHLQDQCRLHGIDGARPGYLTIAAANTYSELFLLGLGDDVVMLPKSIALMYASEGSPSYCFVPVEEKSWYYDIRAFYRVDPDEKTRLLLNCLERAIREDARN